MNNDDPQADLPTPGIMQLEVLNHNDFMIMDRFDGVPLVFPPFSGDKDKGIEPGQIVTISPDAALHLFGFPGEKADMAVHMAKRFGWSGREYLRADALGPGDHGYALLAAKIEIRPVYFDLVRRARNEPIPADDGRDGDDLREPTGDGPAEGTKVGKRKRTPAKFGGTTPRRRVDAARDGRAGSRR